MTTLKPIWSHSRRHSILKLAVDEAIEVGVVGGHDIIESHAQRLHPQGGAVVPNEHEAVQAR